jgi:hypothetical protein
MNHQSTDLEIAGAGVAGYLSLRYVCANRVTRARHILNTARNVIFIPLGSAQPGGYPDLKVGSWRR